MTETTLPVCGHDQCSGWRAVACAWLSSQGLGAHPIRPLEELLASAVFAVEPPGQPTPEAKPPRELYCGNCACEYPVWCAPNALWNAVVRAPSDAAGIEEPFLCLTCFAVRAEEQGVRPTAWVVRPERAEDMPGQRIDSASLWSCKRWP